MDDLTNVEECGGLNMLTFVINSVFSEVIWYSRCSIIYSTFSGTPYFPNTLNITLGFLTYLSNEKVVSFLYNIFLKSDLEFPPLFAPSDVTS